ncbi:unnamed protein product, partial [Brachionus calyciflorus]
MCKINIYIPLSDDKVNNHIDKRKRLVQQAVNKLKLIGL